MSACGLAFTTLFVKVVGTNTWCPSRTIMLQGHFCSGETEAQCSEATRYVP